MSSVKGVVAKVNAKEVNTKFGTKYRLGLQVEGEWYNVLLGSDDSAKYRGKLVTFDFKDGQYGKDVDAKTLKVAESASQSTHTGGPVASTNYQAGIKVGHAINVAAELVAAGKADLKALPGLSRSILKLAFQLEAEVADIAETVAIEAQLAAEGGGEGDEGRQEAAAEPQKPAQKTAASAPKGRGKAAGKAAAEAPKPSDDFDDDIPF